MRHAMAQSKTFGDDRVRHSKAKAGRAHRSAAKVGKIPALAYGAEQNRSRR